MILPPFAAPIDLAVTLQPGPNGQKVWLIFSNDRLLVPEKFEDRLPDYNPFSSEDGLYIGTHAHQHLYIFGVEDGASAPEGWTWMDLRSLYGKMSEARFAIAGRALQLLDWDQTNRFCGRCGHETQHRSHERCRECPSCGHLAYPKLAPAVLALVRKGEQILLARGPQFPSKMFSILAGYVDPGETLEQCVIREIAEEVGIEVNQIRYFGSQPWPFSRALMIAFSCHWEKGEITFDPQEIEEAGWFSPDALPELPPPLSLSRLLIDATLEEIKTGCLS